MVDSHDLMEEGEHFLRFQGLLEGSSVHLLLVPLKEVYTDQS
jgi:hypothetical protein